MAISALPSFLALAIAVLAAPSPRANHVIHERRAIEPVDWIDVGRLQPSHILPMKFGLSQQNMHLVEEMLMAVSHPKSPTFGNHMSAAEVSDAFAPSETTLNSVVDWLGSAGITKERLRLAHNKAWVEVNATTAEIEELLNTEYHTYVHAETGVKQIGCHSYSVPEHITEHIDLIRPTVHFKHKPPASASKNRMKRSTHMHLAAQHSRPSSHLSATSNSGASLTDCSTKITPDCLRALYNINYTPTQDGYNSYGIVELGDNSYEPSDLDVFYSKYAPSLVGSRPWLFSVDGGKLGGNVSDDDLHIESDLDIQYASVLTAPLTISLFEVATNGFDDWLDAVDGSYCTFEGGDEVEEGDSPLPTNQLTCGVVAPPYVVSVSYGTLEATFTPKYMARQCTEYAKLGMMGTSVLYSSGDTGVASRGDVCFDATGNLTAKGTRFVPQFPASCPYVTAVGATQMINGSSVKDPEVACETGIRSGGGFSDFFSVPDYQSSSVSGYLAANPPPYSSDIYNTSGSRAYPDLSANGAFYDVAVEGGFEPIFGTSASSPVVGAMVALINDARLAVGKKPLGFLNPTIYSAQFQTGFNDIVSGSNPGCGTVGFNASKGWDPVTGVGTPNFEVLQPLLVALP